MINVTQKQLEFPMVMGQPYETLPDDLFIPPNALELCLESFSGPMDLLLYLIKKENINILELDVSEITQQYVQYIELMDILKFELAAEYLVMAATLAEIKSRMMLPKEQFDEEEARKLQKKIMKDQFDFNDFLGQLEQIKKMGNVKDLMGMIPGMSKAMKDVDVPEDAFKGVEAIIRSMTPKERAMPAILNPSRKARIASGSGTTIQDVNKLIKQFEDMRKMMKMMSNPRNMASMMGQMKNIR